MRTLFKVSRKTWKNTVFSHFFRNVEQKAQKTLFFAFSANFVQSVPKNKREKKNIVFWHFFRNVAQKKPKKRCFFAFLANFVQSVSKNVKKHCFLTLFAKRRIKSSKYADFSHFLRTLYKVSWKTWKNTVLSYFLHNVAQKKNAVFFTFFANFVQSVSKNGKKTLFSHTFCGPSRKKLKKRSFFAFLANFVQSVSKNVKNTVF